MDEGQADDTSSTLMASPSSPYGISPWIWLPLLTLFMGFIIWLCLRNAEQWLPPRMYRALQTILKRLGIDDWIDKGLGRIRLGGSSHGRGRYTDDEEDDLERQHALTLRLDLSDDEDQEGEDDDELPLADALNRRRAGGSRGTRQHAQHSQKLDKLLRLFGGKGRRSWRDHSPLLQDEEDERIVDLATFDNRTSSHSDHTSSASHSQPSNQSQDLLKQGNSRTSKIPSNGLVLNTSDTPPTSSSTSLFDADASEGDAPSLAGPFQLPSKTVSRPSEPIMVRSPSSLRSPSLSRTPSLLAIQEESTSARSSLDQQSEAVSAGDNSAITSENSTSYTTANDRTMSDSPTELGPTTTSSASMSRKQSSSSSSGSRTESELPDWASALSNRTATPSRYRDSSSDDEDDSSTTHRGLYGDRSASSTSRSSLGAGIRSVSSSRSDSDSRVFAKALQGV